MMIPMTYGIDPREAVLRKSAADEVRRRYPGIIEGSPGWNRAFRNRLRKMRAASGRKA